MNRTLRSAIGFVLVLSLMPVACQPIPLPPEGGAAARAAGHEVAAAPAHTASFDPTKYAKVYVHTIEEIENVGRSLLHVSYPVTEQQEINKRMEEVSRKFIEEYRETAVAIELAYQEYKKETGSEAATFVTHYRQSFDVSVANERVIFFDLERSIYTGGTGSSYVIGYIFDRISGAELAISDLFVDDSYLERLAELSRAALAERIGKGELASDLAWVEDGTVPTAENFDNLLFREDGTFVVWFDKYQVAAGVEGVVEVALPVEAIANLLKQEIRELLGLAEDEGAGSPDSTGMVRNNGVDSGSLAAGTGASTVLASTGSGFASSMQQAILGSTRFNRASSHPARPALEDEINCYEVPCVALTFDDGPSVYTEGLLDVLNEWEVRATFFILGKSARIQSETVSRMFAEGHQIGNHTWDHPNLTRLSDELIQQQLRNTDDIVMQIIGQPTPHLRPPYGAYSDRVLAVSGLPIIFWSVDPLDWKDRDAEIVAARIIKSPAGAIILAHDIHKTTVAAVPAIIEGLRSRGIHFVTVTKLFEPEQLVAGNVYVSQPE